MSEYSTPRSRRFNAGCLALAGAVALGSLGGLSIYTYPVLKSGYLSYRIRTGNDRLKKIGFAQDLRKLYRQTTGTRKAKIARDVASALEASDGNHSVVGSLIGWDPEAGIDSKLDPVRVYIETEDMIGVSKSLVNLAILAARLDSGDQKSVVEQGIDLCRKNITFSQDPDKREKEYQAIIGAAAGLSKLERTREGEDLLGQFFGQEKLERTKRSLPPDVLEAVRILRMGFDLYEAETGHQYQPILEQRTRWPEK